MAPKSQSFTNKILASSWLGKDQTAANIWFSVNNIIKAQELLKNNLPYSISAAFTVVKINNNTITIGVPSSAHASRIKQVSPSIIKVLQGGGYNINQVSLQVMSSLRAEYSAPKHKNVDFLDNNALDHFKKLHESLPEGPLADAVANLYKRHSNNI